MLLIKYSRAISGLAETRPAYIKLTNSLDPNLVAEWRLAEAEAMENRGEFLRIFDLKIEKGDCVGCPFIYITLLIDCDC